MGLVGTYVTLEATGGVELEPPASDNVQVPVPQESPVFILLPLAYNTARLNVTSPVPDAGAVQSADQERKESNECVNSPCDNWTCVPRLDHEPAVASRLKPPSPEI